MRNRYINNISSVFTWQHFLPTDFLHLNDVLFAPLKKGLVGMYKMNENINDQSYLWAFERNRVFESNKFQKQFFLKIKKIFSQHDWHLPEQSFPFSIRYFLANVSKIFPSKHHPFLSSLSQHNWKLNDKTKSNFENVHF